MLELIVSVLLAAGATYYVLLPILRPSAEEAEQAKATAAIDEGEDPEDDWSPQMIALRALKEIEFDKATGKLSESDYNELKAKYTQEALAAMRSGSETVKGETAKVKPRPVPSPVSRSPCPIHGKRPELDAVFCSECGRRLGQAAAYCTRCGSSLDSDARYCNHCGARVAA